MKDFIARLNEILWKYTETNYDSYLTKQNSDIIKAVAIVMMVSVHMIAARNWVLPENSLIPIDLFGIDLDKLFAAPGGICVAIFAFCSGYAFCVREDYYKSTSVRIKKILSFLLDYWIIFAIIELIGFVLKEPLVEPRYLLANLFGFVYGDGMKVNFAWYTGFYILVLLLWSSIKKLSTGKGFLYDVIIIIFVCRAATFIIDRSLFNNIPYLRRFFDTLPCILGGYVVAKYRIFDQLNDIKCNLSHRSIWDICFILIGLVMYLSENKKTTVLGISLQAFYAPFIIYAIILISDCFRNQHLFGLKRKLLVLVNLMSKESMNIWYIHCIFFSPLYTLQVIAYWPRISFLMLIWVFILLIPVSMGISKLQNAVKKIVLVKFN